MSLKAAWARAVEGFTDALGGPDVDDDLRGDARPLDDDDVYGFMAAADEREDESQKPKRRPPKTELYSFSEFCRQSNPYRFARLQSDVRWMQKMAHRYGIDPKDARWLI